MSLLQGQDDPSNSKDSSTSSALFDLELSQRGGRAGDLLARLNPSVHALDSGSTHASGDPSVRLPSGLLQRIIYLSRPVMEFELDVSRGRGGGCGRSCRGGSHGLTLPNANAPPHSAPHLHAAHTPPCPNCFAALRPLPYSCCKTCGLCAAPRSAAPTASWTWRRWWRRCRDWATPATSSATTQVRAAAR